MAGSQVDCRSSTPIPVFGIPGLILLSWRTGEVNEEKVQIQVLALAEAGQITVDFRMKSDSPFEKMMKAWCQHQGLPQDQAIFEFNGRKLTPTDTPASCSWFSRDGVMKINARPREQEQPTSAPVEVSQGPTAPSADIMQSKPSESQENEKITIQVVAQADGGENIIDFKMKSDSPFEKMMKAWCQHQGLPQDQAIFEFNGRKLTPTDTPASCSWFSRDGVMKINARPREQEQPTSAPVEVSQGPTAPSADIMQSKPSESQENEKITIQVVAQADGGENIIDFKMKSTSPFEKMMKAWCKHQGLPEDEAIFEFNGRKLTPTDTPASCSWSSRDGVMKINARPREEEQPTSAPVEVSQGPTAPSADIMQSKPSESQENEKITIQVVAQADGGENIIDFKMKSTSPFEKMMKAWCKHQGLPEDEAIFEFNGRKLTPTDTPASCSWSSRDGVMKINARPREEEQPTSAPVEVSQGPTAPSADIMQSKPSESQENEKITIQVVAQADGGENIIDFKMKSTSPFEKMMKAWCKHQGLPEDEAIFEFNGRKLTPTDTPASCSWSSRDGVMKINARPREQEQPASAPVEVSQGPTAPSADIMQSKPSESQENEKITIQVVAQADGGENIIDFRMKSTSPFEKMMEAWCKHQGLPEDEAIFEFNGRKLTPTDTPASCSWSSRDGVMKINARPREEEQPTSAPVEVSQGPTAPSADIMQSKPSESQENEKITIQVVAQADGGENIIDFKMKSTSPFEKMMKAWCKHQGLPEDEAIFEFNGRKLTPTDTPASCSWSSRDGVMKINARPREEEQPTSAPVEVSQGPTAPSADIMQSKPSESQENEKITIQVVAQADGGENIIDFKMKSTSPFEKMMKAWCKQQGLPEDEAIFEFNGRKLTPTDTPASCSWSSRDGVMKINARPREEEQQTSAPVEVSQGPTAPSADIMQSKPSESQENEKITIQVVAQADGGENIIDFKMKSTSPFEKMMKAWCQAQGVASSDAIFDFNGRELTPNDTPASCSWSSRDGVMRVNARPRELKATAVEENVATASHDNEVVNTDSIPSEVEGQVSVQVRLRRKRCVIFFASGLSKDLQQKYMMILELAETFAVGNSDILFEHTCGSPPPTNFQ